jgi:hypothetical protein
MKNLKRNFVLSFVVLILFCLHSCAVRVPPNEKTVEAIPIETIQYSDIVKVHSRALFSRKDELFIAASDGMLYTYNLVTKTTTKDLPTEGKEYRDLIHFGNSLLLLAVGDSSETINSGFLRKPPIFSTEFDGIFLDGIDNSGKTVFLMGDPTNGIFNLYISKDEGITWNKIETAPEAFEGEAGFAASGTNVKAISNKEFAFVSGGDSSRFFRTNDAGKTWSSQSMGFNSCATCGAYSFTITRNKTIVAVGGDYLKPNESEGTCRLSEDGGKTWFSPTNNPKGYRSNVCEIYGALFTCGTNGIDISIDNGKTWTFFAKGNYFTLGIFDEKLAASTMNGTIHLFKILR